MTEWPEFGELDLGDGRARRCAARCVVDGRNFLDPDAVRAAGLIYEAVGAAAGRRNGARWTACRR